MQKREEYELGDNPPERIKIVDPSEHDLGFIAGQRHALITMIKQATRELGYDDPEAEKVSWISEREHAIAQLRALCEVIGDNDWDENLHLGDIIEKHVDYPLRGGPEAPMIAEIARYHQTVALMHQLTVEEFSRWLHSMSIDLLGRAAEAPQEWEQPQSLHDWLCELRTM